MGDRTNEPLTPMQESTAQVHELFTSLMEGGFTEDQALRMVVLFIVEQSRGNAQ